jgi:hypothetical protein
LKLLFFIENTHQSVTYKRNSTREILTTQNYYVSCRKKLSYVAKQYEKYFIDAVGQSNVKIKGEIAY